MQGSPAAGPCCVAGQTQTLVATGQPGVLQGYPAESLSAGLCIVAVVVAVNLLGERLSERNEERR